MEVAAIPITEISVEGGAAGHRPSSSDVQFQKQQRAADAYLSMNNDINDRADHAHDLTG